MFKELNIIYDGHCGFCIRSLKFVRALDTARAFRYHDAHQPETFALFPELRDADVEDAMFTLAKGEPPYRGFFAFRRLLWSSPLMWVLIPIFYAPGAAHFGPRVYTWVARNRSRLGCKTEVCELPAKPLGQ